jgi:RNA polymerase sigma-70 factor (ECF subfamily)
VGATDAGLKTVDTQLAGWMGAVLTTAMDGKGQPVAGDPVADSAAILSALVEQYSQTLYRVAYSVLRNAEEAEDAVQETFLRVLRHRATLGEVRDHRVWLIRITWNISLDRKRRAKTRPPGEDIENVARQLVSRDLPADRQVMALEHHARVLAALAGLPGKEREVLLLSAFEELSTPQIAAILGTTDSSVRSRLFRARRQLAALLGEEGEQG